MTMTISGPSPAEVTKARSEIRSVISRFARALASGDGATACSLLDAAAQQQIVADAAIGAIGASQTTLCQRAIGAVALKLDRQERTILRSTRVGAVTVKQDMGSVDPSQITSPHGDGPLGAAGAGAISLIASDGQWLIDGTG